MVEIEFLLSDADVERLFILKAQEGYNDMTGNDFAALLLERELHRLCPRIEDSN